MTDLLQFVASGLTVGAVYALVGLGFTLIIITIGASLVLRGAASVAFDKQFHSLRGFSGEQPVLVFGARVLPQTFWVLGGTALVVTVLAAFFTRTRFGRAVLATEANRIAAQIVGINTSRVVAFSFAASAAIGAVAGLLVTPITLTSYDAGTALALKGFAAAVLGGMGSPVGAVAGGLLLGMLEALGAAYISSQYKDAVGFLSLIAVLIVMPRGLFGGRNTERV